MTTKPCCVEAAQWLKHYKGRTWSSPFTDQDWPAWRTFVHALDLWSHSDGVGRGGALQAMRGAVQAMQPSVRHLARDVIPYALDWQDIVTLWPRIDTSTPVIDGDTPLAHDRELRHFLPGGSP
jgi:hypothetical protein